MKPLRQRKTMYHQMKRQQSRKDKRVKLYLMNQNKLKIRKQKDRRRRRRVIAKMWRMRQMYLSRTGRLPLPTLTA